MADIRVLFVEDDPIDRELTLRHLRQHAPELEVRAVGTGREAREIMASERFDLILLDYRLPDTDGLQLLQELLAGHPHLPVIMVTGSGNDNLAIAALKLGAIDYLTKKPGYLDRLPVVIREALRRFRFERNQPIGSVRILYAEHDPSDVDLTQRHLTNQAAHLSVETASTGDVTLRQLETGRYDCLLLDYRMPDMNGIEILQALRERAIYLPVVMITGHGDEETAVQALKLGAADYVVKQGAYLAKLPSAIESAIARWALAEEKEALLALNGIASTIASTLDLNEVLQRVAFAASSLLKTDRSLVSLLSGEDDELVPAAWSGWPSEMAARLRFHVGQGIPGRAAALRQVVSGLESLPEATAPQERSTLKGETAVMRLSAPLMAHDRVLGVLSVAATGARLFRTLDEKLLLDLATYAAVGIENARMYEEIKRAALQLEATVEARTRELQVTNMRLHEAIQQAQEASQHKSDFLAHMSHELRTPLNSILGFSELLQAGIPGPTTEKQTRFLHHIHDSGAHLLQLINDLLDLSKVEAGKLELRPEAVPLTDALTAAIEQFRAQTDLKGVTLSLQANEAPAMLEADPLRFKQILYNLLSNAIKFTPTGGSITVTAKIVSRSESGVASSQSETLNPIPYTLDPGDCVAIAVSDTGIGIKAEDISRLFQEFSQLDTPLAKVHGGTGLGLALTKRLVEMHGGTVAVTSPGEGHGSTFTVTLPLQPPHPSPQSSRTQGVPGGEEAA